MHRTETIPSTSCAKGDEELERVPVITGSTGGQVHISLGAGSTHDGNTRYTAGVGCRPTNNHFAAKTMLPAGSASHSAAGFIFDIDRSTDVIV